MIKFENVDVHIHGKHILKNINLTLSEKKIALIGANGSGKSTFLRLINALYIPQKGKVYVDGLDTKKEADKIRRHVGFIFQNPDNQIIMPTVEEDLEFGLKNLKIDVQERQRRIDRFLQSYNLEHLRKQQSHFLSGGEKQLLAFGSVLVMHPKILLCDEPTTQLDYRNSKKINTLLEKIEQDILVSSHDFSLLQNFDRVLVFDKGEIVYDGKRELAIEFYKNLMDNIL